MPMQASTDVAEVAIEAIRPHGRRASIARGWANLSLIDDADGDHRTPVHGRRQTAAVRDGSLELPPRPGCPYSGTTLSRKALRGLPQYRRNWPGSIDHRGCAAAGHGCLTLHSTTLEPSGCAAGPGRSPRRSRLAALFSTSTSARAAEVEFQARDGPTRQEGDAARGKALALLASRVRRSRAAPL